MRIKRGAKVKHIQLPAIDGSIFDTNKLEGSPFMLSFFRFAGCPFCNMRVNQLVKNYQYFQNDFTIAAIFDSPLENLIKYARQHDAPFPILADEDNTYYRQYGIEHSFANTLKGVVVRMPTLLKGMLKGYIPTSIEGRMTTMPADFLVNRNGIIREAYYGSDEGDHLPIDKVINFSKATGN